MRSLSSRRILCCFWLGATVLGVRGGNNATAIHPAAHSQKLRWNAIGPWIRGVLDRVCQQGVVACESVNDCAVGQQCEVNADIPTRGICKGRAPAKKCVGAKITYIPGKAVVSENGLLLSQGLTSRILAVAGKPVALVNGQFSKLSFHSLPDGAAIFEDPASTQYKYVSNSESETDGGVGSLTFDADGNVLSYERLLSGTTRNCGGGKTFWNTWLTCEEVSNGQIWEVDPFFAANGTAKARKTVLAATYPAPYESAAYDNRNPNQPMFYATIDDLDGPLLKFTPSAAAIAIARDTKNYTQLLHTASTASPPTVQYLVVQPSSKTFSWTTNVQQAEQSAANLYKNCEGIGASVGKPT